MSNLFRNLCGTRVLDGRLSDYGSLVVDGAVTPGSLASRSVMRKGKVITRFKRALVLKLLTTISIFLTFVIASALLSSPGRAAELQRLMLFGGMDQKRFVERSYPSESVRDKVGAHGSQNHWETMFNQFSPYGAWKTNPAPGTCCGA